jgi:hypothetical protein
VGLCDFLSCLLSVQVRLRVTAAQRNPTEEEYLTLPKRGRVKVYIVSGVLD